MKRIITSLLLSAAVLLLAGCSRDGRDGPAGERTDVSVSFTGENLWLTKAFGNTHNVDRLLLLPFVKADAAAPGTPGNFVLESVWAKQVDVDGFPVSTTLSLLRKTEYMVIVIGFNSADYDLNPTLPEGNKFTLPATTTPVTVAGIALSPVDPFVPELFSCLCTTQLGEDSFIADGGVSLSGELSRIVSGLSVEITNIPSDVTSIELRAEILTTHLSPVDGTALEKEPAANTDSNLLGTQAPDAGGVSFDVLISPTAPLPGTKLYLDITRNGTEERYEVKVADTAGVSSANVITFTPNSVISITGDYNKVDTEFVINTGNGMNLDGGDWDGLD